MNHQPESRVRENRMHGSEGGGAGVETDSSYPYRCFSWQLTENRSVLTNLTVHIKIISVILEVLRDLWK